MLKFFAVSGLILWIGIIIVGVSVAIEIATTPDEE